MNPLRLPSESSKPVSASKPVPPLAHGFRSHFPRVAAWAMGPQTAMVGVFLVVMASGFLLVRGRWRGQPSSPPSHLHVTESGQPALPLASASPAYSASPANSAPSPGEVAEAPGAATPAREAREAREVQVSQPAEVTPVPQLPSTIRGPTDDRSGVTKKSNIPRSSPKSSSKSFDHAMADYRAKRFGAALSNFDFLAARGNLEAGLWAARSARAWRGCRGALGRYDRLAANAHGTPVGFDAVFEGAVCRKALGSVHDARSRFLSLLSVPSHASKARGELSSLNENKSASGRERSSGSFGPSTATP